MSILLILNPGSRGGHSSRRHRFWISELEARGVEFQVIRTNGLGDARELARAATGYRTVVAVGGDGTINEVLDGVLLSGRRDLALGVLYAGTSPDFCRFHGISTDPAEALDRVLEGAAGNGEALPGRDAVAIRYRGRNGRPVTGHFGCSCSVGMGAAVASLSNRIRPRLGDVLGTGAAVLSAIFSSRPLDLRVTVDGQVLELLQVNHLVVLKNPYIASGIKLGAHLAPDDGKLCLVAISGRTPLGMLRLLPGLYTGEAIRAPGVLTRECTRVSVAGQNPAPLEFDGDPHGTLPLEAWILPGALKLAGVGP